MSIKRIRETPATASIGNEATQEISGILEEYARRGVFAGFGADTATGGRTRFKLIWYGGRAYEVLFDRRRHTLTLFNILVSVPSRSAMYRRYREFVAGFSSRERPEHRRADVTKAVVTSSNRRGNVALTVAVKGRNHAYGVRKLINFANETFVVFLRDGPYQQYQSEVLGISHELP